MYVPVRFDWDVSQYVSSNFSPWKDGVGIYESPLKLLYANGKCTDSSLGMGNEL